MFGRMQEWTHSEWWINKIRIRNRDTGVILVQTENIVQRSADRYIALGCVTTNMFVSEQRERLPIYL